MQRLLHPSNTTILVWHIMPFEQIHAASRDDGAPTMIVWRSEARSLAVTI